MTKNFYYVLLFCFLGLYTLWKYIDRNKTIHRIDTIISNTKLSCITEDMIRLNTCDTLFMWDLELNDKNRFKNKMYFREFSLNNNLKVLLETEKIKIFGDTDIYLMRKYNYQLEDFSYLIADSTYDYQTINKHSFDSIILLYSPIFNYRMDCKSSDNLISQKII